jgi:hypothetical protein
MTTTARHTPGQWTVITKTNEDTEIIDNASGLTVAQLSGHTPDALRLIAAAPALLACVKEALELLDMSDVRRKVYAEIIAAAEGRETP